MDDLYDDIYQTLDEINLHIPYNSPPTHGDPPPTASLKVVVRTSQPVT